MRGNLHVRFLGGGGTVMCCCYPTCDTLVAGSHFLVTGVRLQKFVFLSFKEHYLVERLGGAFFMRLFSINQFNALLR